MNKASTNTSSNKVLSQEGACVMCRSVLACSIFILNCKNKNSIFFYKSIYISFFVWKNPCIVILFWWANGNLKLMKITSHFVSGWYNNCTGQTSDPPDRPQQLIFQINISILHVAMKVTSDLQPRGLFEVNQFNNLFPVEKHFPK